MIKITLKNSYEIFSCPLPTKDLALNTNNRNDAIEADHIHYGPLNLNDEEYWEHLAEHWKTDVSVAKKSLCGNCAAFDISPQMKECMPGSVQKDGVLGYCWMHKFKCHSARTCYTWAAGGPIEENDVSNEWAEKNKDQLDEKKKKKKQQKGKRRAAKVAKRKKKKKKDDRCTRIAKRKYDVWPSAYASGAVVKCRQGKIWKGVKEQNEPDGTLVLSQEEFASIVREEIDKVDLTKKIKDALKKEGGAAGMDALKKHTGASKKDIEQCIQEEPTFKVHTDGDIILVDSSLKEELETFLDEKKKKKQQKGKRRATKVTRRKKKAGTESGKESSLRDWFGRKGAPGGSGGWVDCNTCRKDKKTGRKKCKSCGRQKGEKRAKYPSCRPTPGACGESGRGKSWGKKSAKGKK